MKGVVVAGGRLRGRQERPKGRGISEGERKKRER